MLARDVSELAGVAAAVAEDAWKIAQAVQRTMPSDDPLTKSLVIRMARHQAVEAYWAAQSIALIGTPAGDAADEKATLHGQRAERLVVTMLDVAPRMAEAAQKRADAQRWAQPARQEAPDDQDGPEVDDEDDRPAESIVEPPPAPPPPPPAPPVAPPGGHRVDPLTGQHLSQEAHQRMLDARAAYGDPSRRLTPEEHKAKAAAFQATQGQRRR